MALSPMTQDRLWNWKFASALRSVSADVVRGTHHPTENETDVITSLAGTFGNCGHFDGLLSSVVRGCVAWILQQPLDAPKNWVPAGVQELHDAERASRSIHPSTGIYGGDDGNEP